jgi:hypothetical protein
VDRDAAAEELASGLFGRNSLPSRVPLDSPCPHRGCAGGAVCGQVRSAVGNGAFFVAAQGTPTAAGTLQAAVV